MKPLEGLKVLELATVVAAPVAGRMLCDFGAEVIKLESLNGDDLRMAGSSFSLPCEDYNNPMFTMANSGKKILPLNLKSQAGKQIVYSLLESADVVISNIRMPSLRRLGLDYDSIKEKYPKIIYAHFSGYGIEGPECNTPGFDITAFWLRNGAINDWRENGTFPMNPSYAFGDVATSSALLSGILMALLGRQRSGHGTLVKVSLMSTGIWCNFSDIISGQPIYHRNMFYDQYHQTDPFSALYICKDGRYIGIFCNEYERDREKFARIFDMEDIISDPDYASVNSLRKSGALRTSIQRVQEKVLSRTSSEWIKIFKENNISAEIAYSASDVYLDPQAISNHYIEEVSFNGEKVMMPAPPMQFSSFDRRPTSPTGPIGCDTSGILADLGYSDEQIAQLKLDSVIK